MSKSTVYHLRFHEPQTSKQDYYFGSLSAIYKELTEDDVGCKLTALWGAKISKEKPYVNNKVIIRKDNLIRSKQNK